MATEKEIAAYLKLSIPGMSMGGSIGKIIKQAIRDNWSQNQLILAIYKSPAFKARFPGIFGPKGNLLMSPQQYLDQEAALRNVMRSFGLKQFRWDQAKDLGGLIARGVTPEELDQRLHLSKTLLLNNPQILRRLQDMFGLSKGAAADGAVNWLLNPDRGLEYFQQRITAAEISLASMQAGFFAGTLSPEQRRQFFLGLAGRGISGDQARSAFAQAGEDWAQFKTLQARFQQKGPRVDDARYMAALFAPDPKLEAQRKSYIAQEQSLFRQTSSYAAAGGRGISGLRTDEAEDRY